MSKQYWADLIPIDQFVVHSKNVLSDFDRRIVTTLYQPLIGSGALSLYMTLWNELEKQKMWGEEMTHYSLMVNMGIPLKDIYQNRRKLEAIGLMSTLVSDDEPRKFIYEILPPLSPERFFDDTILAVFLFRQVGSTKYIELRQEFLSQELDTSKFKAITCSFHDVFESIPPNDLIQSEELLQNEEGIFLTDKVERNIHIDNNTFEFDLFMDGISEGIISKSAITDDVKEAIIRLAFLYNLDHLEMKNIIMTAISPDDSIDIETLRKTARDRYQFMNGNQLPILIERTQPEKYQEMTDVNPTSEKEKLIKQLEVMSPKEWLTALSKGIEPSKSDMKMIEEIMFQYKLPAGVVNVLIDYALKQNNNRLNRNYVDKVAYEWSKQDLKTVRQTMDFVNGEIKRIKEAVNNSEQKKQTYKRNTATRTEMVPEWLSNGQQPKVENNTDNSSDKRKQLEERLKKYKK